MAQATRVPWLALTENQESQGIDLPPLPRCSPRLITGRCSSRKTQAPMEYHLLRVSGTIPSLAVLVPILPCHFSYLGSLPSAVLRRALGSPRHSNDLLGSFPEPISRGCGVISVSCGSQLSFPKASLADAEVKNWWTLRINRSKLSNSSLEKTYTGIVL